MNLEPQPGDCILYTASGKSELSSRLVAAAELIAGFGSGREQYSHAAIMDVGGFQFEAKFPKTGRFRIDTSREYEVWRFGEPTIEQRNRQLDWCRSHVGDWYNLTGVLTANLIRLPGTYYCSQFYGLSYLAGTGIRIGDSIMSPDSLPTSLGARFITRQQPGVHL